MMRLLGMWFFGVFAALGCDCEIPPVSEAVADADLVFRGRITAIRERMVLFRVSRVWQGTVSESFSMVAFRASSACVGFSAAQFEVRNAAEDLRKLGACRPPQRQAAR